jgi:hypothetical protein
MCTAHRKNKHAIFQTWKENYENIIEQPEIFQSKMTGKSKVVLKETLPIEKSNESTYKIKIITYLFLITKYARR